MPNPFIEKVFFPDLESFKQYMPVSTASDIENWFPDIVRAQEKFILPMLGETLYNELLEGVVSGTRDEPMEKLLHQVRIPLAHFTQMLTRAISSVNVDSNGIRMVKGADMVTAWQWMVNDVDSYWLKGGYDGLERLLVFLLKNARDYDSWTSSDEYTEINSFFIRTAAEYRKYRKIDGQYTLSLLHGAMRDVEDKIIMSNITAGVFIDLKNSQKDNNLTEEQEKLLAHVQRIVAHLSIAEASDEIPFVITENGISLQTRAGDHNTKLAPLDADNMHWMKTQALKKGKAAIAEMRKYIDSVASNSIFEEYYISTLYTSPGTTKTTGYDNTDKRIFVP